MDGYNSPSKVSLNTQRLSAMIDSLSNEDVSTETVDKSDELRGDSLSVPPKSPFKNELHVSSPLVNSPLNMPRSPATGNLTNRASIISNYSGVVDEGVEVSYVVRNSPSKVPTSSPDKKLETTQSELPTGPRQESNETTGSGVIIQPVTNAKPVGRFNSLNRSRKSTIGKVEVQADQNQKKDTLHLAASPSRAMHSSIGSGNLASESGTSSYYEHGGSTRPDRNVEQSQSVDDLSSIASSAVQSTLQTNTYTNDDSNIPHIRTETNDFNPTIPPRSKNRPRSRVFLDEEGPVITQRDPPGRTTDSSAKSDTVQSETFYSAASFEEDPQLEGLNKKEASPTISDEQYLSRPLPVTPKYVQSINREDTLKANKFANESDKPVEIHNVDDDYEDIIDGEDEEFQYTPVHQDVDNSENVGANKSSISKQSPKKKNKRKSSKSEIRSFDIETLNHLMNVTKGTLIGSEFSNLGMRVEEKKALERLVDSLSRLTADMVLDPERYEEGLKRLDKATRALEGF